MAIKQRIARAEKRCPLPQPDGWPGLQVFLAESARLEEWLAAEGITADEAHQLGVQAPGNSFVTLAFWLEMERERPAYEAKVKAEQERERQQSEMRFQHHGAQACTSKNETLPS